MIKAQREMTENDTLRRLLRERSTLQAECAVIDLDLTTCLNRGWSSSPTSSTTTLLTQKQSRLSVIEREILRYQSDPSAQRRLQSQSLPTQREGEQVLGRPVRGGEQRRASNDFSENPAPRPPQPDREPMNANQNEAYDWTFLLHYLLSSQAFNSYGVLLVAASCTILMTTTGVIPAVLGVVGLLSGIACFFQASLDEAPVDPDLGINEACGL